MLSFGVDFNGDHGVSATGVYFVNADILANAIVSIATLLQKSFLSLGTPSDMGQLESDIQLILDQPKSNLLRFFKEFSKLSKESLRNKSFNDDDDENDDDADDDDDDENVDFGDNEMETLSKQRYASVTPFAEFDANTERC